jgi:hypothetical protein
MECSTTGRAAHSWQLQQVRDMHSSHQQAASACLLAALNVIGSGHRMLMLVKDMSVTGPEFCLQTPSCCMLVIGCMQACTGASQITSLSFHSLCRDCCCCCCCCRVLCFYIRWPCVCAVGPVGCGCMPLGLPAAGCFSDKHCTGSGCSGGTHGGRCSSSLP